MAIRSPVCTAFLLAAGLVLWCGSAAQAQSEGRAIVLQQDGARSNAQRVGPVEDGPEVRALVVFIRFRDDVAGSEAWIPTDSPYRGWPYWQLDADGTPVLDAEGQPVPADFETLPPFAHHFVAPSRAAIPDVDSTLSAYFYHQSKPGPDAPAQFHFWGDVLPTDGPSWDQGEPIVYVTEHDNAWYASGSASSSGGGSSSEAGTPTRRGYGYLTKEVLDHLVEVEGVDLGHYNLNPEADDVVDQIFLIVRSEVRDHPSGVATLAHVAGGLSGTPPGAHAGLWYPSLSGRGDPDLPDSVRVDWGSSGQYLWNDAGGNVHQPTFYARYGAHEYGHTLWRAFMSTHLWGIDNAVPANGTDGTNVFGGLLMGSSTRRGQRHVQLAHTISAYERSLLGWVALDTLTASRRDVRLGDLYTVGEAAVLPIGSGDEERVLFLSNRQRLGYFDRPHVGVGLQGERYTKGFPLTGLLAHLRGRRDAKDCSGRHPCIDLLPPDNVLDDSFVDDAYKPGVKTQLSPWTRPSISGCNGGDDPYCQDVEISWAAIDDVRYLGDADSTIVFDFVADVRAEPFTVRADSWLGAETDGTTLRGEICVEAGATLTVEAGVDVVFGGGLAVEPGGAVVFEDEATAVQPAAVPDCSAL